MFAISDAETAAIRAVYEQRGELSAAIELRRLFPGITDTAQARTEAGRRSQILRVLLASLTFVPQRGPAVAPAGRSSR
jgi:hypothetical protein